VKASDAELARELAGLLDADADIVTELRTAGLKPADIGAAFRRRTALPPDRIDLPNYRIRLAIGEGGMGVVYAALRVDPSRPAGPPSSCAVKILHVSAPEALARFRAEAAIMQSLDHPGIARVLDAGEANGQVYIAMELVDGATLDAHVKKHAPPRARRLELFAQICDAVHHAHERGVIHRDLKPGNIMVRRGGGVAILDFGVARVRDAARTGSTTGHTQQGDFLGTPLYMSPEQAIGRPDEVDARADVYSLGIILFELVAGAPPYELKGLPLPAAVRTILLQPPRRLGEGDPLDPICARALGKKPHERFASAAELAAAVRAVS
jgi:serine/threonine protein kinase